MNCQQAQKLIPAIHDAELDAANTLQLEEHISDCPTCFRSLRALSDLSAELRNPALRFAPPAGLRDRISAMVAGNAASERQALSPSTWLQYGGWAAAVVAVATSLFLVANRSTTEDERLIADLTASHVRSMMATHLTDVASTDQHTVKPWFDGKLDFAPPVQDHRVAGFPLVGGRLDYISQRPVAALVYGRNKHYINLFIWPTNSQREQPAHASERYGYHVVRWSSGNMMYAAVSDLNESELQQFANLWQDVR